MVSKPIHKSLVTFSVKVYQVLLVAYPSKFQLEYGPHMVQVFQDYCLRTVHESGPNGMPKLWGIMLLDLIQSIISEHAQKEAQMKKEMKPEDIRRAGWALILGGISFVISIFAALAQDSNWSEFSILVLVFVSLPLLVFGVLGLRTRYGEKVGSFGKGILMGGAILGPVTSLIGFFPVASEPFWMLTFAGPAVLFACLTLFGLVAFQAKPLPQWNVLPILAGLAYPVILFLYMITSLITGDWSGNANISEVLIILLITIQGIALLALGSILKTDVPDETAIIA
jgi:hypothetical protein